jgi:hypothetical protein
MYATLARPLLKTPRFATAVLTASSLRPVLSRASELAMFEQGGSIWCAQWNRQDNGIAGSEKSKLAPFHLRTKSWRP